MYPAWYLAQIIHLAITKGQPNPKRFLPSPRPLFFHTRVRATTLVSYIVPQIQVGNVDLAKVQILDISALCVHPACVTSVTLTSLRMESGRGHTGAVSESIVFNVSGRLLLVQRESHVGGDRRASCSMPTVLASCVENVWVPHQYRAEKVRAAQSDRIVTLNM